MKRLIYIAVTFSCLIIWLSGGCERPVVIDPGRNKIPPEVAGTWQMRGGVWRMVIEPNGVVSSAIVPTGEVLIRPNQTTYVEMIDGNVSTYTGGDCFAEFNPVNGELFVYIEVNDIHIRAYNYELKHGYTIDTFTGSVTQDGKIWTPNWLNIFYYGPEFPMDANEITPTPCIFDKVEPGKPAKKE